MYNVFHLDRADITGEAQECAAAPSNTAALPVRIRLERADGYRAPGKYTAVVALDTEQYAVLSMSIEDADGFVVEPPTILELGPDYNYPWRALDFSDPTSATYSTPRRPPPQPSPLSTPTPSPSAPMPSTPATGRRLRAETQGRAQAELGLDSAESVLEAVEAEAVAEWRRESAAVEAAMTHFDVEMDELRDWRQR